MVFMININLLPPEYRTTEKAPIGFILMVTVGVLFVLTTVGGLFMLKQKNETLRGNLKDLEIEKKNAQTELDNIIAKEKKITEANERQETIMQVSMSKIFWSQKLIELSRIVGKHKIWIQSMKMEEGKKAKKGAGILEFQGWCRSKNEQLVTYFRKDLLRSRSFYSIFENIESYKGLRPVTINVPVKDERQRENLVFKVTLILKKRKSIEELKKGKKGKKGKKK